MEQFLEAVHAAAARVIGEQGNVADPDDVDDIFIPEGSHGMREFADLETTIANSSHARRAVGLPPGDPVPPGYVVCLMRGWLSESIASLVATSMLSRTKWSRRLSNGCGTALRWTRSRLRS